MTPAEVAGPRFVGRRPADAEVIGDLQGCTATAEADPPPVAVQEGSLGTRVSQVCSSDFPNHEQELPSEGQRFQCLSSERIVPLPSWPAPERDWRLENFGLRLIESWKVVKQWGNDSLIARIATRMLLTGERNRR